MVKRISKQELEQRDYAEKKKIFYSLNETAKKLKLEDVGEGFDDYGQEQVYGLIPNEKMEGNAVEVLLRQVDPTPIQDNDPRINRNGKGL